MFVNFISMKSVKVRIICMIIQYPLIVLDGQQMYQSSSNVPDVQHLGYLLAAKQWKRMVTKATFVGPGFTRKPPKYERFVRPSGLRFTKAHVTHPELKCTFNLEIIGVKKNPNGTMYTSLGVITKGTIIEVTLSLNLFVCWNSSSVWSLSLLTMNYGF